MGDTTDMTKINRKVHRMYHVELHKCLDELMADFIDHTGKLPSRTTVAELMEWSYKETLNPTEKSHA